MAELGAPLPVWGFSSSPVVAGGAVIVYAGAGEKGWVAYGAESGELVWSLPQTGMNFSSAQLHEIDGDEWLILNGTDGIVAVDPTSGKSIWSYKPSGWQSPAMVQPHGIGPGKLIVALGDGIGLARLDVERGETENVEWVVTERWSSRQLKPSFNDFVYFEDHCYGFDQNIFVCLDASNGVRKWKRGRYGFGQVILLRQARQLLVLSESGELVLLQADPSEHRELGRVPAIKGKTWNHPAVAGGKLFVRNGEEAACFDLSMTRAEAH